MGAFELEFTNGIVCQFKNALLKDKDEKIVGVFGIMRDISKQKRAEEALRKAHDELEMRVDKRTAELKRKTVTLAETNIALNILLKKGEREKKEIEEKVVSNVQKLIKPYLEKLKKAPLDPKDQINLTILEDNLRKIISPFAYLLSVKHFSLTNREVQVAKLIRHGKTTKEIAEITDLTAWTVQFHRRNLRSKLGLRNRKENLKDHLLSLTE